MEAQIQEEILNNIEQFINRPGGWRSHPLLVRFDSENETRTDTLAPLLENGVYKKLSLRANAESSGEASKAMHRETWEIYFVKQLTTVTNDPSWLQQSIA